LATPTSSSEQQRRRPVGGFTATARLGRLQLKITQIFNINHLVADEFGVVNPDVRRGLHACGSTTLLEEWFVETKLPISAGLRLYVHRGGSQPFVSDFAACLPTPIAWCGYSVTGWRTAINSTSFVDQAEKDTNSQLNTFDDHPR
jgi:hypothetical protein